MTHVIITSKELLIPYESMPSELVDKYSRFKSVLDSCSYRAVYFIIPPEMVHKVLSDISEYVMTIAID